MESGKRFLGKCMMQVTGHDEPFLLRNVFEGFQGGQVRLFVHKERRMDKKRILASVTIEIKEFLRI